MPKMITAKRDRMAIAVVMISFALKRQNDAGVSSRFGQISTLACLDIPRPTARPPMIPATPDVIGVIMLVGPEPEKA
jgi:hypothetical protein